MDVETLLLDPSRKNLDRYISADQDIDIRDNIGNSLLHIAVDKKFLDIIDVLLKKGIDISTQNSFKYTALHIAVRNGMLDTVKLLVEKGIDLDIQTVDKNTALHIAISYGRSDIAIFLIESGSNIFIKNDSGLTMLQMAVRCQLEKVSKILIEKGSDISLQDNGETLLTRSIKNWFHSISRLLVVSGIDLDIKDKDGKTALYYAIVYRCIDIAQLLLDSGVDVDKINNDRDPLLHTAISMRVCNTIIKKIIDKTNDINVLDKDNNTALHVALLYNNKDVSLYLVEKNIDINIKNIDLYTALHLSIKCGYNDIVLLLMEKNIDIHCCDIFGNSPMRIAIYWSNIYIARLLMERTTFTDLKGYKTILHDITYRGYRDMIILLLDNGIYVNYQDDKGDTPLHVAYRNERLDIIKLLVDNGSSISIKNNKGMVPSIVKYEYGEYRELLNNLIKFVSNIVIRIDGTPISDGKSMLEKIRFRSISLGSFTIGRFYRYANTIKDLYIHDLHIIASSLGIKSLMTKRGYCKYIAERLESYIIYTRTERCNRYRSVIGETVILQNHKDLIYDPIEDVKELYILLDNNGRYYGFSRNDYEYVEMHKKNPHSTSMLTDEHMYELYSFFNRFDGVDCKVYRDLL